MLKGLKNTRTKYHKKDHIHKLPKEEMAKKESLQ